jgi:hypothetical protein
MFELLEQRALLSGTDTLQITDGADYAVAQYPLGADQQVSVSVYGADGNADASYNGNVTLALDGTNPGTLGGTVTVAAVAGVATFSDVTFSAAGDYTLTATDDAGDTPAPDYAVTGVMPATTRCQLVILQQPTLDAATGTFSLTIGIEDALGHLVPNDATDQTVGEALPAELVINSGPDGAAVYDGVNQFGVFGTLNPDGTQAFTGIKVSAAGTYTFQLLDATPVASAVTASIDLPPSGPAPVVTPTPVPVGGVVADPIIAIHGTGDPTVTFAPKAAKAEKLAEAKAAKAAKVQAAKVAKAAKVAAKRAARAAHAELVAQRRAVAKAKRHAGIASAVG